MNFWKKAGLGALFFGSIATTAFASEKYFTYSYEPETMAQGTREFENAVTLRTQRNDTVGQHNYNLWKFRQELEYGVTDNYTAAVYLNESYESFTQIETDENTGRVTRQGRRENNFDGVSIENRWMILDPATHPVGVTLYFEPRIASGQLELEEKIIFGQRAGDWKWAFNVTHATEWTSHFDKEEGELEFSLGLARELNKHWALGVEARNHNELPEYDRWENTAFFAGPVLSYRGEKWWFAATVMAQVYGKNYGDKDPDGNASLELEGHERLNVRCIVGIPF